MIDIEFRGLEEQMRRFANVPGLNRALDAGMSRWANQIVRSRFVGMGHYPPPRPGSPYIRTGTLGAGWTVSQRGPLQHRLANPVLYATYVVGERQAWMHRGRWWMARARLDEAMPPLLELLGRTAAEFLERGRSWASALFSFGRGPAR